MAYDNLNRLSDKKLIDPQVLGEFIDVKLPAAIKFAPMCNVNRELEGRPGSTLTLPMYDFIGYATDVEEGEDIPMASLATKQVDVKVKKAGRGVSITDEAILSAYGNPVDEIAKQLLMAIAGKVDNDCVAALRGANQEGEAVQEDPQIAEARNKRKLAVDKVFDKYVVSQMMTMFGEDLEENMIIMINPAHLAELRKDDDFVQINNGQAIISGEIGQIFGCRVVVSNKVKEDEAFLVKDGAVEILMKKNVAVEADRDIVNKTNVFVVDEHYAVYLKQPERIVIATGITKA